MKTRKHQRNGIYKRHRMGKQKQKMEKKTEKMQEEYETTKSRMTMGRIYT
jgi:DNA-binding protein YbaB